MVYAIVVNDNRWSCTDTCHRNLLNFRRNIRLRDPVSICWVNNLHNSSATNCSHSIRGGPIAPGEKLSSCLSFLPYISIKIFISFKWFLTTFENVLEGLTVPVLLNPVTTLLPELIMFVWSSIWLFLAKCKSCAD